MKSLQKTLLIAGILLSRVGLAQQTTPSQTDQPAASNTAIDKQDSPAQRLIAAARKQLAADPKRLQAYNDLALGFVRLARETADSSYLKDADSALDQALKLDSQDFQLLRTRVAVLLARHDFAEAKKLATSLNHRTPDDVMTYGYLAEADLALGNYSEAEENAQWMMNLRPNNTPALLVGAKLRTLFGDDRGAIEFLEQAYSQTSPLEVEELAWIANQIASIQLESGEHEAAEQALQRAEKLFPGYPYTMENLARVRMAQKRPAEAVQLLIQEAKLDHDPHIVYELGQAQEASGQLAEAQVTFANFERLAGDAESATDQSTIDLILLHARDAATAPDALKMAQLQVGLKQDVWTMDAYAWALCANAKYEDADIAVQKAIAVGIKSAQIFDHAGHIAAKLDRGAEANKYYELAVRSNSSSEFAADARISINSTTAAGARGQIVQPRQVAGLELQSDAPHDRLAADSLSAGHDVPSAASSIPTAVPVFAPVAESLMIPHKTGTEEMIRKAQSAVTRAPGDATAFAGLGAAYFQRARETGDVSDYQLAEQSLAKSLDLDSTEFSSEAAYESMAEVCMGEHRFADALTYAHKALSLGSGELSPFAIVGDAYADMGEYSKAEDAYGRLTPRDTSLSPRAAYARDSRIAYLRFIAGDTAAAIKLMHTAVTEGIEAQLPSENLAWLYYELGEFETQAGDSAAADADYIAALTTHPGDYRALAALARLRANHGRYAEAIVLYQRAISVVPMPTFIAELGDAYAKTGNETDADKQYALVEYIGMLGHINQVLHNRDLAVFYADHDIKLGEALDLAKKELEVRQDVYTWDALAWALYKNGKFAEAAKASEQATRFGTRDALLLFHAGMIAEAQGQRERARDEMSQALQINSHFHLNYAGAAKQRLEVLQAQSESKEGPNSHAR